MATMTRTLKLPFLALNKSKRTMFADMQAINTDLANQILAMPKKDRKGLSTKAFRDVPLGSAWINQTIRNANAKTKVKRFKCLPLETNNQNWSLHKEGETYSVSFGLQRGIKKRVPLAVHHGPHQAWLDRILNDEAKKGSIKLSRSRKGVWYALLSVSMDVPDAEAPEAWIGVDRGQNIPAVVALPDTGRGVFYKAGKIKHVRREFAKRRKKLQKAGKIRAIKKLESRERRMVTHINHKISKEIVGLAKRTGFGIRIEDLSNIRKTSKQRKKTKSDAGQNRDYWPFYQLEQFVLYKAVEAIVPTEHVDAPYTSKTHSVCGHIGKRKGHSFYCANCDKHEHADLNAARNIGKWDGMFCAVDPSKASSVMDGADLQYGVHDSPPNWVRESSLQETGEARTRTPWL